mgnify:CR=1 FL=1
MTPQGKAGEAGGRALPEEAPKAWLGASGAGEISSGETSQREQRAADGRARPARPGCACCNGRARRGLAAARLSDGRGHCLHGQRAPQRALRGGEGGGHYLGSRAGAPKPGLQLPAQP